MIKILFIKCFFIFLISTLSAQEITFFQGVFSSKYYIDDKEVKKDEINRVMKKNKDANLLWEKSKKQFILNKSIAVVQLGLAGVGVYHAYNFDYTKSSIFLYSSIGIGIGNIILQNSAINNRKKSILTYNKGFDKKTSFFVSPVNQGLGLCLNF